MTEYSSYLFLLVGLIITTYALLLKPSKETLKATGKKAEGIVFSQGSQSNISSFDSTDFNSNIKDKVTIRFVTENEEWITGDIKQEFAIFYSRQYKDGEKVTVYYDPKKPADFYIDSKQSPQLVKIAALVVGLTVTVVSFYIIMSS